MVDNGKPDGDGGRRLGESAKVQDCAGAAATERLRPAGSFGRGRSIPFGQDGDHQPLQPAADYLRQRIVSVSPTSQVKKVT